MDVYDFLHYKGFKYHFILYETMVHYCSLAPNPLHNIRTGEIQNSTVLRSICQNYYVTLLQMLSDSHMLEIKI